MSMPRRPWYSPIALAQRFFIYLAVGYLVLYAFLYFEQNSLLYPGAHGNLVLSTEEATHQARLAGLVPWEHPTAGSSGPQGYVRLDFAGPTPRGTIVMFHGNGEWSAERPENVSAFTRRGFRVFLYEYPGYGGRPGYPDEKGIVSDARALIRSLDQAGFGPVYVWGESLGSGVSAAVCADPTLPVHGLALLMPWDTLAHAALSHYPFFPISLLLREKYDSLANLEHFKHPICIVHGNEDPVIPSSLSLNLFAHLPDPKKIILEKGYGHGDWPREANLSWWDDVLNFIAPPERALVGR